MCIYIVENTIICTLYNIYYNVEIKITTNIIVYMICLINIISIRHIHTLEFSSGWGLNVGQEGINETWINFQYQTSEEIAIKGAEVGIPSLYYF